MHFMKICAEAPIQPNSHGPDMRPSRPGGGRVALHPLHSPEIASVPGITSVPGIASVPGSAGVPGIVSVQE